MNITVIESDNCGCCLSYRGKITDIAEKNGISLTFTNINDEDIPDEYDFNGLPFTIVRDGDKTYNWCGDMSEEMIKAQLGIV